MHHGPGVRIIDGLIAAATLPHRYFTCRRLPGSAIDLVDEAWARYIHLFIFLTFVLLTLSYLFQCPRHTRNGTRSCRHRKVELKVKIHALEREKDAASKERLHLARNSIAEVEERLQLKATYENEKTRRRD